jgi:ElaA protein
MPQYVLKKFDELTVRELHAVMALRSRVFVVEQQCIYSDPDDTDLISEHLLVAEEGKFCGSARIFKQNGVVKIGRVVVDPAFRGRGLGKAIMKECLRVLVSRETKERILIHAQARLHSFYENLGFKSFGEKFLEDGIEHWMMEWDARKAL